MQNSLARLREREGAHRAAVGRVRVPSRARVKNRRARSKWLNKPPQMADPISTIQTNWAIIRLRSTNLKTDFASSRSTTSFATTSPNGLLAKRTQKLGIGLT